MIIQALRKGLIEHEARDTGGVPRCKSSCPDRLAEATAPAAQVDLFLAAALSDSTQGEAEIALGRHSLTFFSDFLGYSQGTTGIVLKLVESPDRVLRVGLVKRPD